MKIVILFCATVGLTLANGVYHQESSYRASSASYRNNELQRSNDDQGFYSKAGDLEGRVRPKINAHDEHSEYVNPKLREGYNNAYTNNGYNGGSALDGSSFGQLSTNSGYRHGEFGQAPMYPNNGGGYASGYQEGGYQSGSYHQSHQQQSYGVQSNLRQVTENLQEEMARELQRAIAEQHSRTAAYHNTISQAQMQNDMRILEEELRRNVTMRMQEALRSRYGNQGVRGPYSYSIMNGRLQPTANYNNQELVDLTNQIQNDLMRQLENGMRTYYHTEVRRTTSTHTTNTNNAYQPVVIQPRPFVRPEMRPFPAQPMRPQTHFSPPENIRYPPVVENPDSITTIATRVQNDLNEHLNKILDDTQRRYFSEGTFNHYNYENILNQLERELRANITFQFEKHLGRNYAQYGNYNSNRYSIEDIQNLQRQIETNLITKLNRDFNKQRERHFSMHQSGGFNHVSGGGYNHVYQPVVYPYQPNGGRIDTTEIQRRLQADLSRQLQAALMQHQFRQMHQYSSAYGNPQANYQTSLNQLTAELNRNLTQQLESSMAQYAQMGAYNAEYANLRDQLQNDLQRQLQQGLQQSFSRYSSWSSSSSSSSSSNNNFRPVRGFDQGLYHSYGGSSDIVGDDCMMGDDPSAYQHTEDHQKNLSQQTEDLDEDLTQQTEDLTQQTEDLTQQTEDLTQQTEDLTQQTEDMSQQTEDLTQQSENGTRQRAHHNDDLTQENEDLTQQLQDLTQQIEDLSQKIEKPQKQIEELTQKTENSTLLSKQTEDDDLTQKVEDQDLSQKPEPKQQVGNTQPLKPKWHSSYGGSYGHQFRQREDDAQPSKPIPMYEPQSGNSFQTQYGHTGHRYLPRHYHINADRQQVHQYYPMKPQTPLGEDRWRYRPYRPTLYKPLVDQQTDETWRFQTTPRPFNTYPSITRQQQTWNYPLLPTPPPYQPYEVRVMSTTVRPQFELNQPTIENAGGYGRTLPQQPQNIGQVELGQQTEDNLGSLNIQNQLGQQVEDLNPKNVGYLGQQTEDDDFEKLEVGNQQVADLSQQTQDVGFGKLNNQVGQQNQDINQVDLGQQVEDDFGKFQVGNQMGQRTEDNIRNLEQQQVESKPYDKLEIGSHQDVETPLETNNPDLIQQVINGQNTIDDDGLTTPVDLKKQQIQDLSQNPVEFGQQSEDLTQQVIDNNDLTQKTHDEFGQQTENLTPMHDLNRPNQHIQKLNQQLDDLRRNDAQQVEDFQISQQAQYRPSSKYLGVSNQQTQQPIEPQIANNQIFKTTEETPDFNQQQQQTIQDAEKQSQALIDALKRRQPLKPMQYNSKPVYAPVQVGDELHYLPVGTTRNVQNPVANVNAPSPYQPYQFHYGSPKAQVINPNTVYGVTSEASYIPKIQPQNVQPIISQSEPQGRSYINQQPYQFHYGSPRRVSEVEEVVPQITDIEPQTAQEVQNVENNEDMTNLELHTTKNAQDVESNEDTTPNPYVIHTVTATVPAKIKPTKIENSEAEELVTTEKEDETTTTPPGFWKKLKNKAVEIKDKVKTKASELKEKIG